MQTPPTAEHEWLHQMVGEWSVETLMESGATTATGSEIVRSLGGLWILAEGEGSMGDGPTGYWRMTLGYEIDEARFVGTWVGSMMANMFVYEGQLDAARRVLTLATLGPDMKGRGRDTGYRDVIEIGDPDLRTMTSFMQQADGEWLEIMKTSFRRRA